MEYQPDPRRDESVSPEQAPYVDAATQTTLPLAASASMNSQPHSRRSLLVAVSLIVLGIAGLLVVLAQRLLAAGVTTALVATATVVAATLPPASATPLPVTTPTIATPTLDQRIDAYISHLSPSQQIGELLMIAVYADSYSDSYDAPLQQWQISNAIVFTQYNGGPLKPITRAGMQQLIRDLQAHAGAPLLIATDEEGGGVDRLAPYYGPSPAPSALAATGDPHQAYLQAATDALRMHDLGVNVDFAPLADVYQGGALDPSRTFGTTVGQVTTYAGAFLDGLQQHGIMGTLKHWPGLGATSANPDDALPTLSHSQAQLNALDFASFHQLLSHQPGMIMATHVIVPAYDARYPASLSPTLIDGQLRAQLGYQGVVVTDAMDANSIVQFMQQQGYSDPAQGIAEASVLALLAGNDIVECPIEPDRLAAVVAAVKNAIQTGRISSARLHQSLHRIIALKVRMGLITLP